MYGGIKKIVFQILLFIVLVKSEEEETKCYGRLGCFPTTEPWFSLLLRPFPAPQSPEEVGTNIYYFNRDDKVDGKLVYNNSEVLMNNTDFHENSTKTFFITHGFMASGNSSWMTKMKDIILGKIDANIFLVDWGKGAETINYFQAASNARVTGAEIARFINYLIKNYELSPSTIHLIGHSLGAHISSYAAKNVTGIGRVTGLDPAQPGFEGLPKDVRIDQTDATFVDVIHTNIRPTVPTLGFGLISTAGHVDIYMNGGIDQPGCYTPDGVTNIKSLNDLGKIPFKALAKWISCSHGKSYEYFMASLEAKCKTWARKSGKVRSITNAITFGNIEPITAAVVKCSPDTCTELGLKTPDYVARGAFAATTIRQYPFCDASDDDFDEEVKKQISTPKEEKNKTVVSSVLSKAISIF